MRSERDRETKAEKELRSEKKTQRKIVGFFFLCVCVFKTKQVYLKFLRKERRERNTLKKEHSFFKGRVSRYTSQ